MSTRRQLGVSDWQRLGMLVEQGGVCAICGAEPPAGQVLAVDRDHTTGRIRGLLCHRCNVGLGWFDDNPQLLEEAIRYLLDGPADVTLPVTNDFRVLCWADILRAKRPSLR